MLGKFSWARLLKSKTFLVRTDLEITTFVKKERNARKPFGTEIEILILFSLERYCLLPFAIALEWVRWSLNSWNFLLDQWDYERSRFKNKTELWRHCKLLAWWQSAKRSQKATALSDEKEAEKQFLENWRLLMERMQRPLLPIATPRFHFQSISIAFISGLPSHFISVKRICVLQIYPTPVR